MTATTTTDPRTAEDQLMANIAQAQEIYDREKTLGRALTRKEWFSLLRADQVATLHAEGCDLAWALSDSPAADGRECRIPLCPEHAGEALAEVGY